MMGQLSTNLKGTRTYSYSYSLLDLNRGVNPFGPVRRQGTNIGGCHLAFTPPLLYRGEG